MIKLQNLLQEKGIKSVVIIDDGFDSTPLPNDLNEDDWDKFFDDLTPQDQIMLDDLYPAFSASDKKTFIRSSEFVRITWDHRNQLSTEATSALFKNYDDFLKKEKDDLEQITKILQNFGLICIQKGRELDVESFQADLILIDLFLGRNVWKKI